MDGIEALVDQVIAAFDARRRTGWSPTGPSLTEAGAELAPWRERIEARLKLLRHFVVERGPLLERARRRFAGAEWAADFAGVAAELQEMARDDLRNYLVSNGMTEALASNLARGYSIGALLHEG
jgi:hypothetical protein